MKTVIPPITDVLTSSLKWTSKYLSWFYSIAGRHMQIICKISFAYVRRNPEGIEDCKVKSTSTLPFTSYSHCPNTVSCAVPEDFCACAKAHISFLKNRYKCYHIVSNPYYSGFLHLVLYLGHIFKSTHIDMPYSFLTVAYYFII